MVRPLQELMDIAGREMPGDDELIIEPGDDVYKTSVPLEDTITDILAGIGLMASDLWEQRHGSRQQVLVPRRHAAVALRSFMLLGGKAMQGEAGYGAMLKRRQGARVNITRMFPDKDGRWIHLHGGFPKLQQRTLEFLGCGDDEKAIEKKISGLSAFVLEEEMNGAGLCAAVARSEEEWLSHAQGRALLEVPVVEVLKIGDSPAEPACRGPRPLAGVRCLDLTRVLAGPVCGRTLAAHGATVMRVNAGHVPVIPPFLMDTAHGKRSTLIDLGEDGGREKMLAMVREADIFTEGYRPGTMERFGLSPRELAEQRPGIICTSISCYGHNGPWRERAGWEQMAQTATGMAVLQGGMPSPAIMHDCAPTDYSTGYLAAYGTMVALRRRAREGGSYHVRVSLCRTAMFYLQQLRREKQVRAPSGEELRAACGTVQTDYGELTHLLPAERLSETNPRYDNGPLPLGVDAPVWPS